MQEEAREGPMVEVFHEKQMQKAKEEESYQNTFRVTSQTTVTIPPTKAVSTLKPRLTNTAAPGSKAAAALLLPLPLPFPDPPVALGFKDWV